jgi:hypothetical protein
MIHDGFSVTIVDVDYEIKNLSTTAVVAEDGSTAGLTFNAATTMQERPYIPFNRTDAY